MLFFFPTLNIQWQLREKKHAIKFNIYCYFIFSDIQKLSYSALVLTMIFSMGEAIPVQHYGKDDACCVFSKIFSNILLLLSFPLSVH